MEDLTDADLGEVDGCDVTDAAKPDYKNSRYVEYNRWSTYAEVDGLVAFLVSGMDMKKSDSYRMNMKVIVLDLYDCYLSDPEQFIGYHRGNDHYDFKLKLGKEDRYVKNPHVAAVGFVGCIDYLIQNGYVLNKSGGHFYDEIHHRYYGLLTKMRPTRKFADLCDEYGLTPRMIGRFKQQEVIVKKGKPVIEVINGKKVKVKYEVKYRETPKVIARRTMVQEYNAFLERCHIDIDVECMSEADKDAFRRELLDRKRKSYEKIRLGSKRVYRVFNNDSFKQGGRYYGGFWIGCPSLLRKYITINGKKTVELDYSGIHVQLLYAMKGVNYASLGEDAYSLMDNDPERELNKLILLTALNADGEKPTAQSIFNQLRKEGDLQKYGIESHEPIKARLAKLKEKHPLISEYIAKGYGVTLQYYDSCIIEKLIEYSVSHGIPILTIHDSVICQEQYADFIRDKMWQYYRDFAAAKFGINIKYRSIQPNAKPFFKGQLQLAMYKVPASNYIETLSFNPSKYQYHYGVYGRSNPIIKVKEEARSQECNKECSHYSRVEKFKKKQYVFLRDVTIRLGMDKGLGIV